MDALKVEILAGDFSNRDSSIATLLASQPEVFAHNLETVERLTPRVRDGRASFRQSLAVLEKAKSLAPIPLLTKSALMLGLGEQHDEVRAAMVALREAGVDIITLGQYMRPTKKHLAIKRWVPPEEFDQWSAVAEELGFLAVASGPLVRSSYRADHYYEVALRKRGAIPEALDSGDRFRLYTLL